MKNIPKVADLIKSADALLFMTGAGMGVGSGLGTFRGKNAGIWPPLEKLGICFSDMSNPQWFSKPEGKTNDTANFAWAFWKWRWDAYTQNAPHTGYHLLNKWAKEKKHGAFSFTSNIDGHWLASGTPADRVYEIHGTIRYQQCHAPKRRSKCETDIWPVDKLDLTVDPETNCITGDLPKCQHCSGRARPNVLMFGDWGHLDTLSEKQNGNYNRWINEVSKAGAKVVIIEIGAGTAVPTVRMTSEKMARKLQSSLIRINPDVPEIPSDILDTGGPHFSFTEDAVAVLTAIDKHLHPASSQAHDQGQEGKVEDKERS